MERNPLGQEPENDSTLESRTEPESAFAKMLRRLGRSSEKAETDDSDEDSEKPKKFRKFFRNLFPSMVERPDKPGSVQENRRAGFDSLFAGILSAEDEPSKPEVAKSSEVTPISSNETILDPPEEIHQQLKPERTSYTPQAERQDTTQAEPNIIVTPNNPVPSVPEREVIIERGPGIALPTVLVVAEHFGRKRADRKLDAKHTEKHNELKKEQITERGMREELTHLVNQNKEQLETLKRERGIEQRPKPVTAEKPRLIQEKMYDVPKKYPEVQVSPEMKAQRSARPAEQEVRRSIERAEEMAKDNAFNERLYERRHEVKDNKTTPVSAIPISAIVADRAAQHGLTPISKGMDVGQSQAVGELPVIADKATSTMYASAIKNGFWAAIVVIVFGVIAYLLK